MIRIILWVIYNLKKRICLRPSNSLSVISLAWVVGFSSGSQCAHHWAHHWATVLFSSQLSKNSVIGTWMGGGIANATFGGSSVWEMTLSVTVLQSQPNLQFPMIPNWVAWFWNLRSFRSDWSAVIYMKTMF